MNLLKERWTDLDSFELRLLLDHRIPGPGQYRDLVKSPNVLCLPLANDSCKLELTFDGRTIIAVTGGPAFDAAEWEQIGAQIETSILAGSSKVGRGYTFAGYRVPGSWRGERSGVQILPPRADAPRAPVKAARHPFILEFPIIASDLLPVTIHRWRREHRNLTLLLNVLLAGGTNLQPERHRHFWANVADGGAELEIKWVQEFFFANLGSVVLDELSPSAGAELEREKTETYYERFSNGGDALRIPDDLDESICRYSALSADNRANFDRAAFWIDIASRQWYTSVSASFAALVSAIEALTARGERHAITCPKCGGDTAHEVPGTTRRFKDFLEKHAPGASREKQRNQIYTLRSDILHGTELMVLDQALSLGWDPPSLKEETLHHDLWFLTRLALRNWLKSPPADVNTGSQR